MAKEMTKDGLKLMKTVDIFISTAQDETIRSLESIERNTGLSTSDEIKRVNAYSKHLLYRLYNEMGISLK